MWNSEWQSTRLQFVLTRLELRGARAAFMAALAPITLLRLSKRRLARPRQPPDRTSLGY
jgi:hypothetical protein